MSVEPLDRLEVGPPPRRPRAIGRRIGRAALAYAGTSLVLLVVSLATSRGWRAPVELPPLDVAALPAVPPGDRHPRYAVDVSEVITAAGARARVLRPRGAEGTVPGVVLVAGAGRTTRDDLAAEAEALARGGLAVLTYDKRTTGYSPVARDFGGLAVDALQALDVLARQPGVDPGRLGLLGFSEGGWVVPLAAERSPSRVRISGQPEPARVAFTVLVSPSVVSPLDEVAWAADRALSSAPDAVRAGVAAVLVMGRPVVGYLDHDVVPALGATQLPTYVVWGEHDPGVPVAVAVDRFRAVAGGHARMEVVAGAGHRVAVASGWADRVPDWVRRGYPEDIRVQGRQPDPLVGLPTLPSPSPVGDPRLHLLLAALVAAAAGWWPGRQRSGTVRTSRRG